MKHGIWVLAGFLSVATACGDGEKGLGEQVGAAISDIDVVKEAEAAANKIIRNASDCEFVKAEVEGVVQTLDDVDGASAKSRYNLRYADIRICLLGMRQAVRVACLELERGRASVSFL